MNKIETSRPVNQLSAARQQWANDAFIVQPVGDTVGLFDAWLLLKRHKWLITSIVLLGTICGTVFALTTPKTYTANSVVVLERKDTRPFATDASTQTLDRDRSAAETEMDVLVSRQFAGRIVDRLSLVNNAEYNPTLGGGAGSNGLFGYVARFLRLSSAVKLPLEDSDKRDLAITKLLSQYSVSRNGDSLAVNIVVVNPKPGLAALIANTIAKLYVESSLELKKDERSQERNRALSTGGTAGFLRQGIAQPLLVSLRSEEARLLQKRDELSSKLGKRNPQYVENESQIVGVQGMIAVEVKRILQDLEAEALKPSARILSSAAVPTSPTFPKPRFIVPASLVGSALLAFLAAVLLEITDKKIRSGRRISQLLHVPNLGHVPTTLASSSSARMVFDQSIVDSEHDIGFSEFERSIYMASRFSDVGKPNSVLMITACNRDATTTSLSMKVASAAASDGRSTVFIDLDAEEDNLSNGIGTVLPVILPETHSKENGEPAESAQKGRNSLRFDFVDARGTLFERAKPLNTKKFDELLREIKKNGHDLVVINAPPVLAKGDANWLSPFVDGVILVVNWGKTTEEELLEAAMQLRMNRAQLIGTILNQVNPGELVGSA